MRNGIPPHMDFAAHRGDSALRLYVYNPGDLPACAASVDLASDAETENAWVRKAYQNDQLMLAMHQQVLSLPRVASPDAATSGPNPRDPFRNSALTGGREVQCLENTCAI